MPFGDVPKNVNFIIVMDYCALGSRVIGGHRYTIMHYEVNMKRCLVEI